MKLLNKTPGSFPSSLFYALPTFVLLGLWLCPTLSHAHKLRVFAWVAGDIVTVESRFSGGRTLVQGTVEVQDAATGEHLLQGQTNEQGVFTFSLAETVKGKNPELRIIVSGGEGHQNEWLLKPEDYQQGISRTQQAETPKTPPATLPRTDTNSSKPPAAGPGNTEELTRVLDQLLEAKLAPIRRSLAQAEDQGPKVTDILGGIGYLIGLAGIVAWMKSKKTTQ